MIPVFLFQTGLMYWPFVQVMNWTTDHPRHWFWQITIHTAEIIYMPCYRFIFEIKVNKWIGGVRCCKRPDKPSVLFDIKATDPPISRLQFEWAVDGWNLWELLKEGMLTQLQGMFDCMTSGRLFVVINWCYVCPYSVKLTLTWILFLLLSLAVPELCVGPALRSYGLYWLLCVRLGNLPVLLAAERWRDGHGCPHLDARARSCIRRTTSEHGKQQVTVETSWRTSKPQGDICFDVCASVCACVWDREMARPFLLKDFTLH